MLHSPNKTHPLCSFARRQGHWCRQVLLLLILVGAAFWSLPQQSYAQTPNRTGTNVALGKPATQSSTYPPTFAPNCFVAAKAVNGNTNGVDNRCSMSITLLNTQAWWQVDLQTEYQINSVDLWNRTDCCADRLSNFDVRISRDGQTWTNFYYPGRAPTLLNMPINAVGRYVRVQLRGTNYLQLAEVQVWATTTTPPSLEVSGNNVSIADGDSTPATTDNTDFGTATVRNQLGVRTFTLRNTGGSNLTGINVTLTGAAAGDYAVTLPPATTVAPNGSATFQVRFLPSALGARTATVNIASNDSARNPYTFAISGTGVAATPGPVVAWGLNDNQQSSVPSGLDGVIAIGSGQNHSLALKNDGTVVAWGDNSSGQTTVPAGLTNVVAIATGFSHNLALKSDGTVVAWGWNSVGQGTVPAGVSGVVAIAAGYSDSAILKNDGTVTVWGSNYTGQRNVPAGLSGVRAIAAGAHHLLALKSDGTVIAWGSNFHGQRDVPAGLTGVVAVAAAGYHSLALKGDGTVVAWGWNNYGQAAVPLDLNNVVAISAGLSHSLALKADGTVVVWGSNSSGQGIIPNGLTGVTAIAAGTNHNLVLVAADTSAPDTSITSDPGNPNKSSTVTFAFSGVDNMTPANGLTFQCQLDGGTFTACNSPQSYSGVGGGNHSFAVRAVDGAGNVDSSAATYTWTMVPPAPLISVNGNDTEIENEDATPTVADHTDFISATVGSGSVVRTFVIRNDGDADLTGIAVTLSGAEAGSFTVTNPPATSVVPGNHTTFQVRFSPSAVGTRTATVNIASNDSTQTPYTFAIAGTGTSIPRPTLLIPGTPIRVSNGRFSLPVQFTANDTSIAALGFVLGYDGCLIFNPTDDDDNGVPDAITGLPAAFAPSISYQPAKDNGQLEIALLDDTLPIASLSTGPLFTIEFTVNPVCITTDGSSQTVTLAFGNNPAVSFSDPSAVEVDGTANGAAISLRFNAAPTALALSNDNIDENVAAGTTVGTLSTTDPDAGDSHSYSLVDGEGSDDNAGFTLTGNALKITAVFNHEPKPEHTIRVRTTDAEGLYFEQIFIIKTNDVDEAPEGISATDGPLSDGDNATVDINENAPISTTVAVLSPSNPDTNNRYTYALVAGTGSTDNGSFTIEDNELKSAAVFDYENKNSYTVRVRITDRNGATAEQVLTVQINDVLEALSAVDDFINPRATVFIGGQATTIDVLANDQADSGTLTVASVTQPATGGGSVTNNTTNVGYTAPQANGSTSFTYRATNGTVDSNDATVSVSYVANDVPGDCNANGAVTAADFVGVVLEIFDANDDLDANNAPAWWLVHTGTYAGSPLGCDANGRRNGSDPENPIDSITAADITCTVLLFFGHECGTVQAAGAGTTAEVSVLDTSATAGTSTVVTVTLDTAGNGIAAATFALVLDPAAVSFTAEDGDEDGIPDGVVIHAPATLERSVAWNAAAHRLEVALFGTTLPLPTLNDGVLATITLNVAVDAPVESTPLALELVTISDAEGNDLAVNATDGTLTIFMPAGQLDSQLFLPLILR